MSGANNILSEEHFGHVSSRKGRRRKIVFIWLIGTITFIAILTVSLLQFGMVSWPAGTSLAALIFWVVSLDRKMRQYGAIPVLTYHSISEKPDWLPWAREISVHPQTFERHLKTLRALNCQIMNTSDFVRSRQSDEIIPDNTVLLHLDDGYLDNWVAAEPLLKRYGMNATLFISLDFIDQTEGIRPTVTREDEVANLKWDGYLNWSEIKALDAGDVIDIQPHGIDHARVEISPDIVDTVTPKNWRRNAWKQWAASPGNKCNWYKMDLPVAAPIGSPIQESGGALAHRAWLENGREDQKGYEIRVKETFEECNRVFLNQLKKAPEIFCWPQNLSSLTARHIAHKMGYLATTGGKGENRQNEEKRIISRLHMGDQTLGWRWLWMEGVSCHASIRTFQGNLYWYVPLMFMQAIRKLVFRFKDKTMDLRQ